MKYFLFLISFFFFQSSIFAQLKADVEKDILYYSDITASAMEGVHKVRANAELVPLVEYALDQKMGIDFEPIKWIASVKAPDNSFEVISWQVEKSENEWLYHAYIVFPDRYIKLNDESKLLIDDYEYSIGDKDLWFGQLYYNIIPYESEGKSEYVLFGFNSYTKDENIKIAEILSFDEAGQPIFGKQAFVKDITKLRDAKNRIFLKYADEGSVNLNYNPGLEMIVYDHLVPRYGEGGDNGISMIGDGSYEGYQWSEGIWLYKEKLFDHIYEEAPRPNPVLGGEEEKSSKDIFGKPKKKKKP